MSLLLWLLESHQMDAVQHIKYSDCQILSVLVMEMFDQNLFYVLE